MKKICFMMSTVFSMGGEQRTVSCLCNSLLERGYDVSLLLFDNKYEENYKLFNLNKKINIIYVNGYSKFFHRLSRKIRNLNSRYGFFKYFSKINKFFIKHSFPMKDVKAKLNDLNPDILIGVAGEYNLLASLLKEKFSKIITIGWQHSCYDAYFNTVGRRHYHEKKLFYKMSQNFDEYVVLTETDQKLLKENLGIDSTYIYNMKSFESDKTANLDNHQFICAGRFEFIKGFDLLIDAYNIFIKRNPNTDWKLLLVGDGTEKTNLLNKIKDYKLEDNVILPGFKTNMEEIYSEGSIYVMPSRWEGFPMVLGECMEIGLPIISFDINVMKEFINNKKNGILVPKYDTEKLALAMENLANDYSLRKKIVENAKLKVKELSKKEIVDKWEKVFERK